MSSCRPSAFERKVDVLDEYCENFGTDIEDIKKTAVIREDHEAIHEVYERIAGETAAGPTPREVSRPDRKHRQR